METQSKDENLLARFLATQQVKASWVWEDEEGFLYNNVEGSIIPNPNAQSIKFKLQEKNGDDLPFEMIIRKSKDAFFFVTDHPQMEKGNYPCKLFVASDELVFYFEDTHNRAYFHLS